jgi:hypothetical protein
MSRRHAKHAPTRLFKSTRPGGAAPDDVPIADSPGLIREAPTPTSGVCITDGSPSPRDISLRIQPGDDAQAAFQGLLDRRELPPEHLVRKVHAVIKSESVAAIVAEDYDYAERLEEVAQFLREIQEQQVGGERFTEVAKRLDRARADLDAERGEWEDVLDRFREEQWEQRQALKGEHREAVLQYEEQWNDPAALIPYSKPSPDLLRLRKMQKSLALAKRFREAKDIKERADAMQATEARLGEERAMAAIRQGFQVLREKQQREIACFDEHEKRNVAFLELERDRATLPMVMLIKSLEIAVEAEAPGERKVSTIRPEKRPAASGPVTPHARIQIKDFKGTDEPGRLNLNAAAVRKFAARRRAKMNS